MPRKDGTITRSFTFEGKRHYATGASAKEAEANCILMQRDLEEHKIVVDGSITVREWADRAVSAYKTSQSDITRVKYMYRMNHCILEHIGDMKLANVKPLHCQDVLNLQKGNSKDQINKVFQMLNFLFSKAVENKLIIDSPAAYLIKPAGTKIKRRSITEAERVALLAVCEDDKYLIFLLMLYCGCRPSEAREAKGMDIQQIEDTNVLHIRGTKSGNADRFVPIPDALYERLKGTSKFCFIAPNGSMQHTASSFSYLTKQLYKAINVEMGCKECRGELIGIRPLADDFVPYCLRHTYCTDLQKAGIDIRTAQYLMGHSSITLTANIYTHTDAETIIKAAEQMKSGSNNVVPSVVPICVSKL